MSCNFSIPITSSASDVIASASAAIENNGGTFTNTADNSGGTFTVPVIFGTVVGSFQITSGSVNVIIDKKPFFVSCNKIQSALTDYINGTK